MGVPWIGIAYGAFFLCVLVKGVPESWRRHSGPRFALKGVPYVVGTTGMMIFLADRGSPSVANAWRFCFPVVVLGTLSDALAELREMLALPDPRIHSAKQHWVFTALATALSFALQLPYLWMNWRLL